MQNKTLKLEGITSLTNDLKKVYEETRNGELRYQDARCIANVAGKLLKAAAIKMEYNKFIESKEPIDFLKK